MGNYSLRPAQRGNTKPLIGLYSESGRGKTWSALLLARGFVGPQGKIAMIETEQGRGEVYTGIAPVGDYMVCSMSEPFSPKEYGNAINVCEKAGVDALIIDSASHEWEAVGGVLDMAAENEAKGWKGQIVWTKPKLEHSRFFVLRLAQSSIPLVIVCLRAKFPLIEYVDERGKKNMKRADEPSPKQSEDFIYEMLIHGWLDKEHCFHVTKYPDAIPELKGVIENRKPISLESGQRLAAWAAGSKVNAALPSPSPATPPAETGGAAPSAADNGATSGVDSENAGRLAHDAATISDEQEGVLIDLLEAAGISLKTFLQFGRISSLKSLPAERFDKAKEWIVKNTVNK